MCDFTPLGNKDFVLQLGVDLEDDGTMLGFSCTSGVVLEVLMFLTSHGKGIYI